MTPSFVWSKRISVTTERNSSSKRSNKTAKTLLINQLSFTFTENCLALKIIWFKSMAWSTKRLVMTLIITKVSTPAIFKSLNTSRLMTRLNLQKWTQQSTKLTLWAINNSLLSILSIAIRVRFRWRDRSNLYLKQLS